MLAAIYTIAALYNKLDLLNDLLSVNRRVFLNENVKEYSFYCLFLILRAPQSKNFVPILEKESSRIDSLELCLWKLSERISGVIRMHLRNILEEFLNAARCSIQVYLHWLFGIAFKFPVGLFFKSKCRSGSYSNTM